MSRRGFLEMLARTAFYSVAGGSLIACAPTIDPSVVEKWNAPPQTPPKQSTAQNPNVPVKKEEPADPMIEFTPTKGISVIVNNPENIQPKHLGDRNLGNVAIFRGTLDDITGRYHAWYSHLNITGSPIKYGIQLYNPSSKTLEVIINNRGHTTGWGNLGKEWIDFFKPLSERAKIEAGKSLWILKSELVEDGQPLTGAVDFEVNGKVEVNMYAFRDEKQIDGTAKALGMVTDKVKHPSIKSIHDESHVYKGLANGTAINGRIVVDAEALANGAYAGWTTNTCYINPSRPSKPEILGIKGPNGEVYACKNGNDRTDGKNLANWGIIYDYIVEVINTGTVPRSANVTVFGPDSRRQAYQDATVFVLKPNSEPRIVRFPKETLYDIYNTVVVQPNERKVLPFKVVLVGSSNGELGYWVHLKR